MELVSNLQIISISENIFSDALTWAVSDIVAPFAVGHHSLFMTITDKLETLYNNIYCIGTKSSVCYILNDFTLQYSIESNFVNDRDTERIIV